MMMVVMAHVHLRRSVTRVIVRRAGVAGAGRFDRLLQFRVRTVAVHI